ncbi:hypothetical protein, partial [Klebsiella quasipneumoniae]|uniref:hypothetical protein n=1 Tax=Klebsiella quasipneumoniae TaxID=1463165 RepID=UPI0039E9DA82
RGESHEQGHRAWYAYSAGCQLSPPGGLGSDHPTLDLLNKAKMMRKYAKGIGRKKLSQITLYLLRSGEKFYF